MAADRRTSPRFDLPHAYLVVDDAGLKVGRAQRAGGGGMQIAVDRSYVSKIQVGQSLTLTVMQPEGRQQRLRVEVCYFHDRVMGVRFVTAKSASAG